VSEPIPEAELRALAVERVRAATPEIAEAVVRAFLDFDWFRGMDANVRSWIGMFVQREVARIPDALPALGPEMSRGRVRFPVIPWNVGRDFNLEQGVELVRVAAEVVADGIDRVVEGLEVSSMLRDLERYGREFAFAAAAAYARVAEQRGASDAQLQALMIRALVADDDPAGIEASSLGLPAIPGPVRVLGVAPHGGRATAELVELQRAAHHHKIVMHAAIHGPYALAIVPAAALEVLVKELVARSAGTGPVVGPAAPEVRLAGQSARAVLSGLRALPAWQGPKGPVDVALLLPERVLAGDIEAAQTLVSTCYEPLVEAGRGLIETVDALLQNDGSLDGAARSLPVHVNTVRYRLDRVLALTGLDPRRTHDAISLHMALALGRIGRRSAHAGEGFVNDAQPDGADRGNRGESLSGASSDDEAFL
jgi:hypothetical protein